MDISIVVCSLLIVFVAIIAIIRADRAEKQRDFYREHAEIYALMIDHMGISEEELNKLFRYVLNERINKGGDNHVEKR